MKFHLATASGNVVTGVGPGWVRIHAEVYRQSLLLAPDAILTPWTKATFDALTEADFARVLDVEPSIVIFGSGARLRFPHPRLTRALLAAGIGIETMDTPAACRTYNVLAAEGRRVAAALIVDATHPPAGLEEAPELERFRIRTRAEIVAILRALLEQNARVTAHFAPGPDCFVTELLAVDAEHGIVVFGHGADAQQNERLPRAPAARLETYTEHIRVEFSVSSIKAVKFGGRPAFSAPLPPSLLRIQRREP